MDGSQAISSPSPQLAAANRRLYALREQARASRQSSGVPAEQSRAADSGLPWNTGASTTVAAIAKLPDHLGWGSQALTAVLRRRTGTGWEPDLSPQELAVSRPSRCQTQPESPLAVKLYPDIGLGMLRQDMTAPGRVWLLLQHLDTDGRGMIRIATTKTTLTQKPSNLYLCGWRQLRNLLQRGQGIFWHRDRDHIWLRSAAKVAANLDVTRLTGKPVSLPLAALLSGIGQFRAELYAAFHSGRTRETRPGERRAQPIARETLARLSGVGGTSQRTYEARTRLAVQRNYAIGEVTQRDGAATAADEQRIWRQGTAIFPLQDHLGHQGQAGRTYLAWQLPNSYLGSHKRRPKGRQRRINRKLKDLVTQGTPGNVGTAERSPADGQRRYFGSGAQAVRAAMKVVRQECYWPLPRFRGGVGGVIWQTVGGIE